MKIDDLWKRLNYLVPEPQCFTQDNDYDLIIWKDNRSLPTYEKLIGVNINNIPIINYKQNLLDELNNTTTIVGIKNIIKKMIDSTGY